MFKLVMILLICSISSSILSAETMAPCLRMEMDGQDRIPFTILVIDSEYQKIEGAKVRIIKMGPKGGESEEAWNTTVVVKSFESDTNKNGEAFLSPAMPIYESTSLIDKQCKVNVGYSDLDYFLIVEKSGFHTVTHELSYLNLKRSFKSGEKMKVGLSIKMLRNDV